MWPLGPGRGVCPAHPSVDALLPLSVLLRPRGADCFSLPAELKKQVESAELKNQRLKEVFQTKIQEFRKACYTLTGYQVDITTENQYRLTSMYAEQKADCLIFKVGRSAPRVPGPSLPSPSASTPLGAGAQGSTLQCPLGAEEQGESQGGAFTAGLARRQWAGPGRKPRTRGLSGPDRWLWLRLTRRWEV